ncbi:MAG: flagellin lysine-N-methylase [Lachnospiraceae bacterium]|nr:flagellin lysine-N-methylase [Lachnospiraceae bacterium]
MEYCYISLYTDFTCLAGDCPATCCAGWKIVVDAESVERFSRLENIRLRQDILEHIRCQNSEYQFVNQPDGRCSMLDSDGLCRIQRNLDEKSLCNTCRKFPRLTANVGETIWMSMAASCPVVADYLWKNRITWIKKDSPKRTTKLESGYFSVVKKGLELYQSHYQILKKQSEEMSQLDQKQKLLWHVRRKWHRFELFLDLVEGCLALMSEFPERPYLKGSFDYFEADEQTPAKIMKDMSSFEESWQKRFLDFAQNYLEYRTFSRYLEYQDESEMQRYCQVIGEISLIYIISFSRFMIFGSLSERQVIETINWVYRFCAHGAVLSRKVTKMFCQIFQKTEDFLGVLMD